MKQIKRLYGPFENDPAQKRTPRQWAWEFLRRNAEYQQDWFNVDRDVKNKFKVKRKTKKYFIKAFEEGSDLLEKWEVTFLADPREMNPVDPYGKPILFTNAANVIYNESGGDVPVFDDHHFAIVFDLTQRTEELIELAKKTIGERKKALKMQGSLKSNNRFNMERFPFYLRILDAREQPPPVTFKKIATELSKIARDLGVSQTKEELDNDYLLEQNAIDWNKTAERIRDHDYRFIRKPLAWCNTTPRSLLM